jgi:hypothetical protein
MSEIINIEIKADQSGAKEALKHVNNSLKEGTEAAEALSHALDGDVAGAFKSLGELSKTLGVDFGLAFSPAEIIAFAQVIAEVTDKLSKLIADTFIYTDAMKEQDKALASANKSLEASAARVKALGRETQIAAEKSEAGKEKLRLAFTLEDLGGNPEALRAKLQKATKDFSDFSANVVNATTREGQVEALKRFGLAMDGLVNPAQMRSKLAELENSVLALRSALQVAEAETQKAGQTIKNDLAAEANRSAAEVDRAAKDKKREQDALDAWVAHAVHSRGTLTEAVKRMAKEQEQADIDASQALAKSEEARIAKINADEKAAAEKEKQRQEEAYQGDIEVAKLASDKKIQLIEQDLERGKITQQQEIALIAKAKQDELQLEIFYQQKRQALWDKDPKKVQEIQNQINKIKAQSELIGIKATTDELKVTEQKWKNLTNTISQSLNSALSGWIQGTQTFGQAWSKMADDMAMKFIASLERQLVEFLVNAAVRETVEEAQSKKSALRNAIDAAGKAYHWAAAWGGPPAGAIAAAVAFTAVESFGSAEGGQYYVPNNQLTMLHPQEMVLPAVIANRMRGVIEGGGGGGVTVVVNHSVSAVDSASFQGHIRRHSNMIANEVTRALKRKGVR